MKEYKVGEQIVLEVQESKGPMHCDGCFYQDSAVCQWVVNCFARDCSDGKNIIFKEVKE